MKLTQTLLLNVLPDEGQAGITTARLQEKLCALGMETTWLKSTRRALQRLEDEGLAYSERQGRHLYWHKHPGVGGIAASAQKRMTLDEALALRVLSIAAKAYQLPWAVRSELNPMCYAARQRLEKTPVGNEHNGWVNRIAVLDEGFSRLPPPVAPAVAETVSMALFKARRLSLRYRRATDAERTILVEPLGWVTRNRLHYLVARQPGTPDIRHYRIDRIQAATMERPFSYPRNFSLKSHIEDDSAFDYPGAGKKIEVVLRFDHAWGAHLLETPVNETQSIVTESAKNLTVRFTAWDSERLTWWIRGFGPHVEILEPEHLRLAFRQDAGRSVKLYAGKESEP
ncbi:MAG: WYL domain-containing protein [Betaproteobacteria bacterium]|nr:WYL domain-containing protein [Betaproteobacteria bacterium]MCL2885233.1 WYL domain-containing protein [Betaproteobacteria bacterium]